MEKIRTLTECQGAKEKNNYKFIETKFSDLMDLRNDRALGSKSATEISSLLEYIGHYEEAKSFLENFVPFKEIKYKI